MSARHYVIKDEEAEQMANFDECDTIQFTERVEDRVEISIQTFRSGKKKFDYVVVKKSEVAEAMKWLAIN